MYNNDEIWKIMVSEFIHMHSDIHATVKKLQPTVCILVDKTRVAIKIYSDNNYRATPCSYQINEK